MKKTLFFIKMGVGSYYAYYFIGGRMTVFNDGRTLEIDDNNVEKSLGIIANVNQFTQFNFQGKTWNVYDIR